MDKKVLRNDIILISSLTLVAAVSLVVLITSRKHDNLMAKIYVQDELKETVDLSKKQEGTLDIEGTSGHVIVHYVDGKIAIIKSNCPHQDCVEMGYVSESNHPIICAYNAVYISIDGIIINDVEAG